MTRLEKIEAIRQKCVEANGSILDLKFGCRFSFKNGVKDVVALSNDKWKRLHFLVQFPLLEPRYENLSRKEILEYIEILGRPITLPDVLLAIDKFGKLGKNQYFTVSPDGFMKIMECEMYYADSVVLDEKWNLLKTMEEQEEEMLDFLLEILGVKK